MKCAAARVVAVAATFVTVMTVGACRASSHDDAGSRPDTSITVGSAHSTEDVRFLQDMVGHHGQAVELAALVGDHSSDPRLNALAQQIDAEQRVEVYGFQAQLLQWEAPPAAGDDAGMVGLVDRATMAKLAALHGAAFEKLWLQSMIEHHRGAITMAQSEIADGQSPDVVGIAQSVAATQQAAIDRMNELVVG
ncbi:MAG: DUF305 domain-containing protein [Mycobacterium sp.]